MKLLFIITGIGVGGAERMLLKVASGLSPRFDPVVVSLEDTPDGLAPEFRDAGIRLQTLGMRGARSAPAGLARLVGLIRRERPDAVSTWLYHADLIGGLAARLAGVSAVAWNIRNGSLSGSTSPLGTRAVLKLNARLSTLLPRRILCCSEAARRIHVELGYDPGRFDIIPNGFDLTHFRPDPAARAAVRAELAIPEDAPLVGLIARFDPQKNHREFIEAAANLRRRLPAAHFLLAGEGCDAGNPELTGWLARGGDLAGSFRLLGRRSDVPRLTAALDVAASSSVYGEAFPNVLGEAMACGVPCVATDIGDSALILGTTGRIVPPQQPAALADALHDVLSMAPAARAALGLAARQRVSSNFELGAIRRRYEQAFDCLVDGQGEPCEV